MIRMVWCCVVWCGVEKGNEGKGRKEGRGKGQEGR